MAPAEIGIRRPVSASIYSASLLAGTVGSYGFLIGTPQGESGAIFDLALVAATAVQLDDFEASPKVLAHLIVGANQTAATAETSVLALFVSWESFGYGSRRAQFARFVETAATLKLPFVAEFPIDGGETLWAPRFFRVATFPHQPLFAKTLPKRSVDRQHNARRIIQVWKKRLRETYAAEP